MPYLTLLLTPAPNWSQKHVRTFLRNCRSPKGSQHEIDNSLPKEDLPDRIMAALFHLVLPQTLQPPDLGGVAIGFGSGITWKLLFLSEKRIVGQCRHKNYIIPLTENGITYSFSLRLLGSAWAGFPLRGHAAVL